MRMMTCLTATLLVACLAAGTAMLAPTAAAGTAAPIVTAAIASPPSMQPAAAMQTAASMQPPSGVPAAPSMQQAASMQQASAILVVCMPHIRVLWHCRGRVSGHLWQRLVKPGQPGQRGIVRGDRALIEAGQVVPGPAGRIIQQRPDFRTGKQGHDHSLAAWHGP